MKTCAGPPQDKPHMHRQAHGRLITKRGDFGKDGPNSDASRGTMREFVGNSLRKRLQDAQRANQARLQKATQGPKSPDPAVVERKAAERAGVQARRTQTAERKAAEAEAARQLAAQAAVEKVEQAELAERNARIEAQAQAEQVELAKAAARVADEQKVALAAHQKAVRDARYAARKRRQR
jgi:hypothetical protein